MRAGVMLAAALLLAPGSARAQRPMDELAKLQADHEKSLASASRAVDDIHRLTLRQLERERAEAGDYEAAARVKARLDALEQTPGTAAIVPPPLTQTLPAARAEALEGASAEGGREYVNFRKTGGKALWDLKGIEKGSYEVFLIYSVGLPRFDESTLDAGTEGPREAPGGTIVFAEVSGLGGTSSTGQPLQKKVVSTGAWENYIRESLGRHEFKGGPAKVKLEAASATTGGLLRLRQIELVKVIAAPETLGAAPGTPDDLSRTLKALRARHLQDLKGVSSALRPRHETEFLKLEQELSAAGKAAGAAAVARMRERLFPKSQKPATPDGEAADPLAGLDDEEEKK